MNSGFGFPSGSLLYQSKWFRWLVLAAILVLIAWLGYSAQSFSPRFILMLLIIVIVGLALFLLLTSWPAFGLVLIIPVNMFVKYSIGTGTQTEINASILLIVFLLSIWILGSISRHQTIRLYQSRTTTPLIIFLIVAIIAFLSGQLTWLNIPGASFAAQLGGLTIVVLSLGAFLLAANLIDDVRWLKWMLILLIIFGGINTLTRLVPVIYRFNLALFVSGGRSSQYWTWFIVMIFSQALLNQDLKKRWRAGLWALFVASIYLAFVVDFEWKSGWMPAFVAIMVIVGLRSWLLGLILGVVGLYVGPNLIASLISSDEYSFLTRIEAWQIVGDIIKVNPLLGLGPANYFWYTTQYRIRGYTGLNFNSHNQYVDLVAQFGILGLLCFLWLFWEVGRVGWELRKRALSGFERAYVYGALGGLVATLFAGLMGDWTLPFVYNVGIVGMRSSILGWLFLGGLVALERLTRQPSVDNKVTVPA